MKVYRPRIQRKGRVFQIVGRGWFQSSVLDRYETVKNGKVVTHTKINDYGRKAVRIAQHIAKCHNKVGIITHKALAPAFVESFGAENVQWFGNLRGTNLIEDVDGLLIFGQMSPGSQDVMDIAAMLDPTRVKPFHTEVNGQLAQPWRPIEMRYELTPEAREIALELHSGNDPSRIVSGYRDPELWTIFSQICVAELTQALHRNRILLHDHVVWVFSPVPLMDTAIDWIADDPPIMPERWLNSKFDAGNPLPFFRWLDLLDWGLIEKLDAGKKLSYEDLANGAGVSSSYARRENWMDGIVQFLGDDYSVTKYLERKSRGPIPDVLAKST